MSVPTDRGRAGPGGGPPEHVTVAVAFVEYPIYVPEEVWVIESDHLALSPNELAAMLREVAQPDSTTAPSPYAIKTTQSYFSWGASGSGEQALIEISRMALDGTVGGLTYAALKRVFHAVLSKSSREATARPLTREEAEHRLRWLISEHFSQPEGDLVVDAVEEDMANGTMTVTFVAPDGVRYEGTIGVIDGIPATSRIRAIGLSQRKKPEYAPEDR